jgi:hypothetical protein
MEQLNSRAVSGRGIAADINSSGGVRCVRVGGGGSSSSSNSSKFLPNVCTAVLMFPNSPKL